jgi:hypothetical protein
VVEVASAPSKFNVLFIGNSFTARNDLPGMVAAMASAAGTRMEHRLISVGGASLRTHWNKTEAAAAIRDGRYDHVVLQEQSTLPVKNADRMRENVRLFDGEIKAAGATTVLYLTWARRHAPETQRQITDAYESIGRELGVTVVPAGVAWEQVLAKHDRPVLHDKDDSHPTVAGTYLAACTFFATLLGQSPVGVGEGVEGLTAAEVKLLQRAAWSVVRGRLKPARPRPKSRRHIS